MRMHSFRSAGLLLCALLIAAPGSRSLQAQNSPQSTPQDAPQGAGPGGRMGGGMGGMFGMANNSAHGAVTAVSGADITLKDEQGQIYKVQTGPNTRFRKDREEAKISDIKPGDTVVAVGNLDDKAKTVGAMFVVVLDPQQAVQMQKMRADFGKTWTAGKVTAIKDLTLTVERPDKVTQTITVDENTTFRKGGRADAEDITFPDIKVGDMVNARGALQSGNFLATTLSVMPPGARGQGRFAQGQPGSENPQAKPNAVPAGNAQPQPPSGQ